MGHSQRRANHRGYRRSLHRNLPRIDFPTAKTAGGHMSAILHEQTNPSCRMPILQVWVRSGSSETWQPKSLRVATIRNQMLTGTSPGSLKVRLMSDGLKEEIVERLIMLALN